ncbi:MAG: NAD+ synthase [Candidatus Poseidoniales archaeon]
MQADPTVGDLEANATLIATLGDAAATKGANLAVSTELVVSGYPPRDLLLQSEFIDACVKAAENITCSIPLLIGTPLPAKGRNLPGNGVLSNNGEVREVVRKQLLPTYDVFDEARYFAADARPGIARTFGGLNLGVTVCEDAWQHAGHTPIDYDADPIEQIAEWVRQGVELDATVNLSASPFHVEKLSTRVEVARCAAKTLQHPFLLANQVGANDDLLFDGRSLAAWPDGRIVMAPAWQEGALLVDIDDYSRAQWLGKGEITHIAPGDDPISADDDLLQAVVSGLSGYCAKAGLKKIVLGLSGGIDSAVAACVASAAVGPENVTGIAMPSKHSSDHSLVDAQATAAALGIEFLTISIEDLHENATTLLADLLASGDKVAGENIQARLRGLIVMAHANANHAMAIATGNKSELAQGYCTLYGDMAGGYAPLGDLYKMEVYDLAKQFNQLSNIPPVNDSTMSKPPSAELAPDQRDDDKLPPYPILDEILRLHIEDRLEASEIVGKGFDANVVADVLVRLAQNEHKRWQMPPAPRVSRRAFGQGWRQPLAAKHAWRRSI